MTVGQRIRAARIGCGMTQSKLCSDRITRNMLSMIENGKASPSLELLEYFSSRLKVPVACFLSDNENQFSLRRNASIAEIRRRFSQHNYNSCVELCFSLGEENIAKDAELCMIMAYCSYYSGISSIGECRFPVAADCLSSALKYASATCYPCEEVSAFAPAFLRFLSKLNFTPDNIPLWDVEFSELECLCPEIAYLSLIRSPHDFSERLFEKHLTFALHVNALNEYKKGSISGSIELIKRALNTNCSSFTELCLLTDLEKLLMLSLDYENAARCAEQQNKIAISIPKRTVN